MSVHGKIVSNTAWHHTGTNKLIGFSNSESALSSVSRNSENPSPDFTEAATVKVFLWNGRWKRIKT